MELKEHKYNAAVIRNIAELNNAILKKRALVGLHDAKSLHALDFFRVSAHALYNDIISHTIKVFENSSQVASFWYIVKTNEKIAKKAAKENSVSLNRIDELASPFKHIRDRTHFHIDKRSVLDPRNVWGNAGIKADDLEELLESAYLVLASIYEENTGEKKELPDYDGSDAAKIIRSYKKCHPDVDISI